MSEKFQMKENSGSLFKNDKKEDEKHPDYKGTVLIGGVEYWQSAWVKDGKNGKFFSQSFTPKEASVKPQIKPQAKLQPSQSDDLPF